MRIALAQINPVIADIQKNNEKISSFIRRAKSERADLIVFPEMATIGYPPKDLLENKKLIIDNLESLDRLTKLSEDIAIICGYVDFDKSRPPLLLNSAAFMKNGKIISKHNKTLLPTYDVFDESRYFSSSSSLNSVSFFNKNIGITICEDIYNHLRKPNVFFLSERKYDLDPVKSLVEKNIDLLINISASPYTMGKNKLKWEMISKIAEKNSIPVLYVNQVGGNDSIVFDGNSFFVNRIGNVIARAKAFEEDLVIFDDGDIISKNFPEIIDLEEIRQALLLGIKDYVRKCGFKDVVIGLSGGIDSALTATLAVQALGKSHVLGIMMPSIYSSDGSIGDSLKLSENLGIRVEKIAIQDLFELYREKLGGIFKGLPEDVTEENIQARIRGDLLMAISNKFGSLLLTTGNKSELSMGYCTLYGDMSGGLAVISDLPKTLVYNLAQHINKDTEIIPREILEKAPSAELRENQKDEDTLPPYELLDQILEMYIEKKLSAQEIIKEGFSEDVVNYVLKSVDNNEYKRIQAPTGIKITSKAFGSGRRIPIAHRFRQ